MAKAIEPNIVNELFAYNPKTGELTLKKDRGLGGRYKKGATVGSAHVSGTTKSKKMYLRTYVDGGFAYVHRIIWVLMTGEQPQEIDHIDGDGLNNKWSNLRNTNHKINGKNQKMHSTNTSGVAGVCYRKESGHWRARIIVDGQMISLGTFKDKFDAICSRKSAEAEHGFGAERNTEAA